MSDALDTSSLAERMATVQQARVAAAVRASDDAPAGSRSLPLLGAVMEACSDLDGKIEQSPDARRRACGPGCSACCHLQVAITAPEALWIATRLRETRSAESFEAARQRIGATAARVAALSIEGRAVARVPCALLGPDGACSIYPFRPLGCRGFTSFDRSACEAALAAERPGHDGPMDRAAWAAMGGVVEGLVTGLREHELDCGHFEFHHAIARAIDDPATAERWALGEDVFDDVARVWSERAGIRRG